MVKEGYYFGVPPLLLGGLAIALHWWILGAVLIAFALFCFSFFRDPDRQITNDPAAIVSPADGRVVVITDEPNAGSPRHPHQHFSGDLERPRQSLTRRRRNLQTRLPPRKISGRLGSQSLDPKRTKHIHAEHRHGNIELKQIAGLVARRVVSWKKAHDTVAAGERIGLVRFGSRVDLWVPQGSQLLVKIGDSVSGGSSVLARWPASASNPSSEANFAAVERQS